MYRVVVTFTDLRDDNHKYNVGDSFPREGIKVPDTRIKELSTENNRRGMPLIVYEETQSKESEPKAKRRKTERR